jgi:hypothetical protein
MVDRPEEGSSPRDVWIQTWLLKRWSCLEKQREKIVFMFWKSRFYEMKESEMKSNEMKEREVKCNIEYKSLFFTWTLTGIVNHITCRRRWLDQHKLRQLTNQSVRGGNFGFFVPLIQHRFHGIAIYRENPLSVVKS